MDIIGPSDERSARYYIGVVLALCCALTGSLKPIVIKHLSNKMETLALVFYTGIGCAVTALLAGFIDVGLNEIVEKMEESNSVT